ncbi:MAG: PorV/PorQ family protein [Candidatus Marinimicrobia bacterium]|nr:PorV/PorQ family protein [Candidatus Neomarinimicrobiota bacterium]
MKFKAIVLITFLLIGRGAVGQEIFEKIGTAGAHFLDISLDARVRGMGDAYAALTMPDASASHYNPATLVFVPSWSTSFGMVNYFAGISVNGGSAAYRLDGIGTVGLSFRGLNSGTMEETTVLQQDGTGNTFEWSDVAIGLNFARSFTDRFAFGMNLKYIKESISAYDLNASAWAVDLGTYYRTGFRSLRLGMTIRNFGPELDFNTSFTDFNNGEIVPEPSEYHPFHMPLTFQVGVAMDFLEDTNNHFLTVAIDAVHPNEAAERLNIGVDYRFMNTIHLRGGGWLAPENTSYAALFGGVGIEVASIGRFDYAISSYDLLGAVHQFSLTISR